LAHLRGNRDFGRKETMLQGGVIEIRGKGPDQVWKEREDILLGMAQLQALGQSQG
jgi:hypothetical protein